MTASQSGLHLGEIRKAHDARRITLPVESGMVTRNLGATVKEEADQFLGRIETCGVSLVHECRRRPLDGFFNPRVDAQNDLPDSQHLFRKAELASP